MNYRVTNKLLKKGGTRVLAPHIYWGILAMVVVVPTSFLFGLQSASDPEGMKFLQKTMKERASAPLPVREPNAAVLKYLTPFGRSKIEFAMMNGNEVWTTAYSLQGETPEEGYRRITEAWTDIGLEPETKDQGVAATLPGGRGMLMATVQDEGMLRLFCWTGAMNGAAVVTPEARLAESGLPTLPFQARIEDLSQPDGGYVFSVYTTGNQEEALTAYRQALFASDWTMLDTDVALHGRQMGANASLFRKDDRQVMISGTQVNPSTTLMTLVVF